MRSRFDAGSASGRLEAGHRIVLGSGGFTPYAAGQLTTLFLPAYAEQVVLPEIRKGLAQSGRKREAFEISGGGFIVTGPDEATVAKGRERVRQRVGFYGSTPAYAPVLELHGLGDLAKKLNQLVRDGHWDKLAGQIPDDVLDLFAAVGTFEELAEKVANRFGGISDAIGFEASPQADDRAIGDLVGALRKIPSPFAGYARD